MAKNLESNINAKVILPKSFIDNLKSKIKEELDEEYKLSALWSRLKQLEDNHE